jgi:type IV pilus assembly protein PilE
MFLNFKRCGVKGKVINDLKKEDGFSLTELLVVIVVIGILILLAMPQFTSVVTKAKETEAKIMLKHLHTLQQAYFYERDTYAGDLASLGFEQEKLVSAGGEARYVISIEKANSYEYTALATAAVDFDKDGTFNVWSVNQDGEIRQVTPD